MTSSSDIIALATPYTSRRRSPQQMLSGANCAGDDDGSSSGAEGAASGSSDGGSSDEPGAGPTDFRLRVPPAVKCAQCEALSVRPHRALERTLPVTPHAASALASAWSAEGPASAQSHSFRTHPPPCTDIRMFSKFLSVHSIHTLSIAVFSLWLSPIRWFFPSLWVCHARRTVTAVARAPPRPLRASERVHRRAGLSVQTHLAHAMRAPKTIRENPFLLNYNLANTSVKRGCAEV